MPAEDDPMLVEHPEQPATRLDLALTRRDLAADTAALRQEVAEFRGEMYSFRNEMYAFRSEMYVFRDEMYAFRSEMYEFRARVDARFDDLHRHFDVVMEQFKEEFRNLSDWTQMTTTTVGARLDQVEASHGKRLDAVELDVKRLKRRH